MTPFHPGAREALQGRLLAIMNTASGSWSATAEADAKAIFAKAGLDHAEVTCVAPAELDAALQVIENVDVLVVLGGDGTIRTAASRARGSCHYLIPLPGGTMNMLPKALYGARAWREALADTLADPVAHDVSGGVAGDHAFFVAALLGAPTLWADARESVRALHLAEAAKRAMTAARRSFAEPLRYAFGDKASGTAEAVAVLCPLVSRVMREDEPMLEAAAVDAASAGEVLRLGLHAMFDDWRADPSVVRAKVRQAVIDGHGRVPVILDGERVRMGRKVEISFVPLAFRSLVPADAPAQTA